jgi:simple sugar transport system permease protein
LQLRFQASGLIHIPYQVFLMLPFLLTILAMALVSRNARAPAALLQPFRKEER